MWKSLLVAAGMSAHRLPRWACDRAADTQTSGSDPLSEASLEDEEEDTVSEDLASQEDFAPDELADASWEEDEEDEHAGDTLASATNALGDDFIEEEDLVSQSGVATTKPDEFADVDWENAEVVGGQNKSGEPPLSRVGYLAARAEEFEIQAALSRRCEAEARKKMEAARVHVKLTPLQKICRLEVLERCGLRGLPGEHADAHGIGYAHLSQGGMHTFLLADPVMDNSAGDAHACGDTTCEIKRLMDMELACRNWRPKMVDKNQSAELTDDMIWEGIFGGCERPIAGQ